MSVNRRTPLLARLNYQHFENKDIIRLMQYIWEYSSYHGKRCGVCKTYKEWAIKATKSKWLSTYINFNTVIAELSRHDRHWSHIPNITPQQTLFVNTPFYQRKLLLPPIEEKCNYYKGSLLFYPLVLFVDACTLEVFQILLGIYGQSDQTGIVDALHLA